MPVLEMPDRLNAMRGTLRRESAPLYIVGWARDEFRQAATMTRNECERARLAPGRRYLTE